MSRPAIWKLFSLMWFGLALIASPAGAEDATNRFQFRLPQHSTYRVDAAELKQFSARADREWLAARPESGPANAVQLGRRLVLQLKSPADLPRLMAGHGLTLVRTVLANTFVLQAPDALAAVREAHRLAALPEVSACYPVMQVPATVESAYAPMPNDRYFSWQWFFENRNTNGTPLGADINLRSAWPLTRGAGVTLAVADTGFEVDHPELTNAATGAPHHNFESETANGAPPSTASTFSHGTAVAGFIGAQAYNSNGVVGAAPEAKLASLVIFSTNANLLGDDKLFEIFTYQSNVVQVQNHSWGWASVALVGRGLLADLGISNAVTAGRNGRGVIITRAAGNLRASGGNANDDGYSADPRIIVVSSVGFAGRAASDSNPGADVLVAAGGGDAADGIVEMTTDRQGSLGYNPFQTAGDPTFWNYCYTKTGTSFAAPQVAGIVALMLAVNPGLTYRDAQQILILSARHFDLTDLDLTTNGAGLLVSHNVGFGVPDAGVAVRLAQHWVNRPANTNLTFTSTNVMAIPDDGLRVLVTGAGVPAGLASVHCLPDSGPHADSPTAQVPLVDCGYGTNLSSLNLTNKGALIQRGGGAFSLTISNAAQAGAAFAVIYNYLTNTTGSGAPGGDVLTAMGATDFVPVPAVFIGHSDGVALQGLFATNPAALAQISLNATSHVFTVTNTLLCEHVGLEVMSDHPSRGDLRITLVSPAGTRSVLQRYSADTNAGPADWTYYTTHDFYESSAGNWTAYFSDESAGATGSVLTASLKIEGVPIVDTDHDGLDDNWELAHFGNLNQGPAGDPDHDGYSNMREQIMGTDPNVANDPLQLDLSAWSPSYYRLSWPGSTNYSYDIWGGTNAAALALLTNWPGHFPETEWFSPGTNPPLRFFRVHSVPKF
jgi:subtilisin family serine protease/subtilisin-like proprotein convertase family protein